MKIIFTLLSLALWASGGGKAPSTTMEVMGNTDCGQEGQFQCWPWQKEFWDTVGFGCDRGLKASWDWGKFRNRCVTGVRQSAKIIKWIGETLKFQRHLLKDEPLYLNPVIDAHNAIQYTKAGIHLIQNQYYSLTDLLNMGVRILSPDVHNYNGNMRMVHCEGNMEELCDLRGRYWSSWLEELKIWIDRNPGEFVVVRIEDYTDKKWRDFTYPIEAIFGRKMTFTYSDLKTCGACNGKMPSLQYLRDHQKRVSFFTQNGGDNDWVIVQSGHFWPGWPREYVKNFDKNNCTHNGQNLFGQAGESFKNERWLGIAESDGKLFGIPFSNKFYDGKKESGDVDIEAVRAATRCGVTDIQMDWVENDHIEASIWSWDIGQPRDFGIGLNCVKQANGRWYTADCSEVKSFTCKNKNNKWLWKVTFGKGKFSEGTAKCISEYGEDYIFDFPTRAEQNEIIRKMVGSDESWIKYSHGAIETGIMGTFWIVPQVSLKSLTEAGDSVIQFGYLGTQNDRQSFILSKDAQGYYQLKSKSNGKCLDSFQDHNGGKIGLWSCHSGDNQKWKLLVKSENNLSIQNKRSGRCLDLNGSKKENYDSLMAWDCHEVIQHYFKFYKQ